MQLPQLQCRGRKGRMHKSAEVKRAWIPVAILRPNAPPVPTLVLAPTCRTQGGDWRHRPSLCHSNAGVATVSRVVHSLCRLALKPAAVELDSALPTSFRALKVVRVDVQTQIKHIHLAVVFQGQFHHICCVHPHAYADGAAAQACVQPRRRQLHPQSSSGRGRHWQSCRP